METRMLIVFIQKQQDKRPQPNYPHQGLWSYPDVTIALAVMSYSWHQTTYFELKQAQKNDGMIVSYLIVGRIFYTMPQLHSISII